MAMTGTRVVVSAADAADPGFGLRVRLSEVTAGLLTEWQVPQRTISQYLRVPQPLVSRLKSGSTERISAEAYVNTLAGLGVDVELVLNVEEVAWRLRTLAQLDAGAFDLGHAAAALKISHDEASNLLTAYRSRLK